MFFDFCFKGGITMKISENGLNLIKQFEGCRLTAYKPVAAEKYWTIGWGHYGADVKQGQTITQAQADQMLKNDMVQYENAVNSTCTYLNLNQNQFDALVSFTYNCGSGNLKQLTANGTRNISQIAEKILLYNKGANGQALPGLVRRRAEEQKLFLTSYNTSSSYTYEQFVRDVQKATGAKVDGIAGSDTLDHTITISTTKNKYHNVVTALERYLKTLGYYQGSIEADYGKTPIFGYGMKEAVMKYQKANSCVVDGEITAKKKTWQKLLKLAYK